MNTNDLRELKRLALAASDRNSTFYAKHVLTYRVAASPTAILALIAQLEQQASAPLGNERAAFEKAFIPESTDRAYWMRKRSNGDYCNYSTQSAWQGWQTRSLLSAQPAAPTHSADTAQELTAAARDVLAERQRQLAEVTPEEDDHWVCDEIAALACLYAMPTAARKWDATSTGYGETLGEAVLPPDWRFTPCNRRDELKKAGALILAEIERIDRAAITAQINSNL